MTQATVVSRVSSLAAGCVLGTAQTRAERDSIVASEQILKRLLVAVTVCLLAACSPPKDTSVPTATFSL